MTADVAARGGAWLFWLDAVLRELEEARAAAFGPDRAGTGIGHAGSGLPNHWSHRAPTSATPKTPPTPLRRLTIADATHRLIRLSGRKSEKKTHPFLFHRDDYRAYEEAVAMAKRPGVRRLLVATVAPERWSENLNIRDLERLLGANSWAKFVKDHPVDGVDVRNRRARHWCGASADPEAGRGTECRSHRDGVRQPQAFRH